MDYVLEDLLGTYWDLAYEEGSTNVSNGTRANEVLHKIREAWNRRASPSSVPEGWKLVGTVDYRLLGNTSVEWADNAPEPGTKLYIRTAPTPPVSEDRKDVERYRWLKDNDVMAYMIFQRSSGTFIDSEIDQAMQEDKP